MVKNNKDDLNIMGSEIIIYQTEDGHTKIDVKFEDETVWLTQAQLCELYQTSKSNISEHIKHIFEEGELEETSVVLKFRTNGFSRESATYIRNHKDEYVVHDGSGGELKLKSSLLTCGNTSVMTEAASINFNVPGLFLEEDA